MAKSVEIIFTDCKRKPTGGLPRQMPGIRRVTFIKMLDRRHHVESSVLRRARSKGHNAIVLSLYVLKLLRHHSPRHEWRFIERRLQGRRLI